MIKIKINDYVVRISYNKDIVFKILSITNEEVLLQGVYTRLHATANIDDLEIANNEEIQRHKQKHESKIKSIINTNKKRSYHMTGKILHIDGDPIYLEQCLSLYKELKIPAYGVYLKESEFKNNILDLIYQVDPDIVVLTGHDSYNRNGIKDLNNYLTTSYFINAVKEIRRHYSKDHIFVFAGGCQSNFEALLAAGCNYASSPKRINIDVYDPAIVAIKAAITPFNQILNLTDLSKTISLDKSLLSGIESYGKMRLLV
ncbi:MAG: sporulation peptidase YabG [bacterium]